jgi:hypothetical protein
MEQALSNTTSLFSFVKNILIDGILIGGSSDINKGLFTFKLFCLLI